jgi:hypothetical protein
MSYESERLKILEMIDNGLITVDEGVDLLKALDQRSGELKAAPEALEEPSPNPDLASKGEKVIFSAPVQPSMDAQVSVTSEDSAPGEGPVDEPGFEEPAASQALYTTNYSEAGQPSEENVYAPEPEPPIEEQFTSPQIDQNMRKWKGYWWIPFWVGVGITLMSAALMYSAWVAGGFTFWFACTWFPFMLGVLVMALAYASRTARWLHVRIHQQPGERPQNIAISLPLPLRLTAWFFRTFKGYIPQMGNTGIDELILALEATNPDTPFYVEVNEGEDGERVEVYIG